MKCIILAAGYATRLYPLTENFPKPLLKVKDKPILDYLVEDIGKSKMVDSYIVISNHKFAKIFEDWAKLRKESIVVVDDGTMTNETRLGAVKDIRFAMKKENIDDDCMVIAGDNLLDFSLTEFIDYYKEKKTSVIMRYYEESIKKLQKCGVLEMGEDDLVLSMEEKPENPKSHFCCPPFYIYKKEDIRRIDEALDDGCGFDAPGSLAAWMAVHSKVHAYLMKGSRYDIGNLESYTHINEIYKGVK